MVMNRYTHKSMSANASIGRNENSASFDSFAFSETQIRKNDFLKFVLHRNNEMICCYRSALKKVKALNQEKLLLASIFRKTQLEKELCKKLESFESRIPDASDETLASVEEYDLEGELHLANSISDVYTFILKKEQKELNLFKRLADLEENEDVKAIFVEHMRLCNEHIDNLHNDFTQLTYANTMTFDDNQETQSKN